MPVTFYPHKPIDKLENYIKDQDGKELQGEINIYRKLYNDLGKSMLEWYVWHSLRLPEHDNEYNPNGKTSCEIDFVIICEKGILALEVKGGKISFTNNRFFYGIDDNEFGKGFNPFEQAQGYKFTLMRKVLNNKSFLYTSAVAFPHVDYNFENSVHDNELLWSGYNSGKSIYHGSIEKFILHVFEHEKTKNKYYNRNFGLIKSEDLNRIVRILSPRIKNTYTFQTVNTSEWLGIDNVDVLEALYGNDRIMIQGPPGSGKTTIAKAFIDKQLFDTGKKGLYLCWNQFLKVYIESLLKDRFQQHGNDFHVKTYTQFLLEINPDITFDSLIMYDRNQYYNAVKDSLRKAKESNSLVKYDFLVVDEAQDVFDQGLDLIIDIVTGVDKADKGLTTGNSLVLYDLDQSYLSSGRDLLDYAEILKNSYAHYQLHEVKRCAQAPLIRNFSIEVLQNINLLNREYVDINYTNKGVLLKFHPNKKSFKKDIVNSVLNNMRDQSHQLLGKDCILLFESVFYVKNELKEIIEDLSEIHDVVELTKDNITDASNTLKYTSILKYKGLEKNNVILVITNPSERNKYELFVGITRAMINVQIHIITN